eukprot:TRINITY_DN1971_c0_g1_i1.p1 TRINITY_DN1971_c0_g1~~TRINITY_DN1971_c0_g1_i1.p1  ORF type:complete len:722 (-),score=71.34 TRINITY_DN1971_c0_g1_i1:762-2927(-)
MASPHHQVSGSYLSAIHNDAYLSVSLNKLLGFSFSLVLILALWVLLKLWLIGSKVSNRKRAFFCVIIFTSTRCGWYLLNSPNYVASLFAENSFVMEYLYFAPMALLYTSITFLMVNWFELYQKEKQRKKLPRIFFRHNEEENFATSQRRREKNEKRLHTMASFHFLSNLVIHFALVLLVLVSDNVEIYLSFFLVVTLLVGCYFSFRRLANVKRATKADSLKLKRHTVLTMLLSLSLLIYYASLALTNLYYVIAGPPDPYASCSSIYSAYSLGRVYELFHCSAFLITLSSNSMSLRAPFPGTTRDITQDWLTNVLRENGTIKSTTSVVAFWTENLKGGCHFKVSKISLRYSDADDDHNKSVVVKLLYWDKPTYEKIILFLKYWANSDEKEVMYLRSYRTEHLFYKHNLKKLVGLKTPNVFYNLEDVFNNRFGMVIEDLSHMEDGQPFGFTLSEAQLCLSKLALFHASNWGRKPKDKRSGEIFTWDTAAYWTATKREANKQHVTAYWNSTVKNFSDLRLGKKYGNFGAMLASKRVQILDEFLASCKEHSTLCHGDFKISNIFISKPKRVVMQRRSSINDIFCLSNEEKHLETNADADLDVYIIDLQWYGYGSCAIDLVAYLCTSTKTEHLGEHENLVRHYHNALVQDGKVKYPWEKFYRDFQLAFLDWTMYCIAGKWCEMTREVFDQYARGMKDGLHLRSIPHMEFIIERGYHYYQQLFGEKN